MMEPNRNCWSGQHRLPILQEQSVLGCFRSQGIVLLLETTELCLKVPDALLQTTHLRYHTRVGTADVAE